MTAPTFVAFCTETLALALTPAWRVLLMVAIDGVPPRALDGEDRAIAYKLFGDVDEVPLAVRRVLIWRLGRASGKTTIAAALAVYAALTKNLDRVGPGQVPVAFVVSPTKRVAKIAVDIARELVRRTALLEQLIEDDTMEGFTMRRPDGRLVEIRCVAASKGGANLRGRDVIVLVLDESEFFSSDTSAAGDGYAVTDRDQLAAAMPRLLGYALCISTPWPTENVTAEYFDKNFGKPLDALAALGPSLFMRPTSQLAQDVAREFERDPDTAAREYECKGGARGGSKLFDAGAVDACVVPGRTLITFAQPGDLIGCGGDLGLERDSSAIAVVAQRGALLELLETDEISPAPGAPLVPSFVICNRFAPLMRRHGARSITMDAHYRQSAIEHLSAEGLRFLDAPAGNQGKYDMFLKTRAAIHGGSLRIPYMGRLVAQLKAVTQSPMPGGLVRISSPRRAGQGHGDLVSALVAAIWDTGATMPRLGAVRFQPVRTAFESFASGFQDWGGSQFSKPQSGPHTGPGWVRHSQPNASPMPRVTSSPNMPTSPVGGRFGRGGF